MIRSLRWSRPVLGAQAVWKSLRRRVRYARIGSDRPRKPGICNLCDGSTEYVYLGENPREDVLCIRCGSIPRQRALHLLLQALAPDWRASRIHESSPRLTSFRYFSAHCQGYVASYAFAGSRPGARVGAFRVEHLEHQTFADGAFDLVVTQDVLEHVLEPLAAVREIARTLRPGGVHVFTVPRDHDRTTTARAELRNGQIRLRQSPEYHGSPIDARGSLVVTDWGRDLEARFAGGSSAPTTAHKMFEPALGMVAPIEVFVSQR